MGEWAKNFFTKKDVFERSMRAVLVAVALAAVSAPGQAALASALGPWGALAVALISGALAGGTAIGEKNEHP